MCILYNYRHLSIHIYNLYTYYLHIYISYTIFYIIYYYHHDDDVSVVYITLIRKKAYATTVAMRRAYHIRLASHYFIISDRQKVPSKYILDIRRTYIHYYTAFNNKSY